MRIFRPLLAIAMILIPVLLMGACASRQYDKEVSMTTGSDDFDGRYRSSPQDMPGAAPMLQNDLVAESGWKQDFAPPVEGDRLAQPVHDEHSGYLAKTEGGEKQGSDGDKSPESYTRGRMEVSRWFSPAAYAEDTTPDEEYLIRTGNLDLKIDDYQQSAGKVDAIADKYQGTVTDSQMSKSYDCTHSGYITLRVPKEHFFACWDELKGIGEVLNANISSEDVSHQYVSAVSKLENLQVEQETLRDMLEDAREVQRQRGLGEAYSVLLDTQERLSEVTYKIESVEDTISVLADRITRSTITVSMSERVVLEKDQFTWGMSETVNRAKRDIAYSLKSISNGLVYFLMTCWIWLVPLAIVVWIIAAVIRRLIRKVSKPVKQPAK